MLSALLILVTSWPALFLADRQGLQDVFENGEIYDANTSGHGAETRFREVLAHHSGLADEARINKVEALRGVVGGLVGNAQLLASVWKNQKVQTSDTAVFALQKATSFGAALDTAANAGSRQEQMKKELEDVISHSEQIVRQKCTGSSLKEIKDTVLQSLKPTQQRRSVKNQVQGIASIRGVYQSISKLDETCGNLGGLVGAAASVTGRAAAAAYAVKDKAKALLGYAEEAPQNQNTAESLSNQAAAAIIKAKTASLACILEQAVCPAIYTALSQHLVQRMGKRHGTAEKWTSWKFTVGDDRLIMYLLDFLNDKTLPRGCSNILKYGPRPEGQDEYVQQQQRQVCEHREQLSPCAKAELRPVLLNAPTLTRELIRSGLYPANVDTKESGFEAALSYAKKNGIPLSGAAQLWADTVNAREEWYQIGNVMAVSTLSLASFPAPHVLLATANGILGLLSVATKVREISAERSSTGLCRSEAAMLLNAEQETPRSMEEMETEAGEASDREASATEDEEKRLRARESLAVAAMQELMDQMEYLQGAALPLASRRKLSGIWESLTTHVKHATDVYENAERDLPPATSVKDATEE